jgi:ERCC4-type nuclease
LYADDSATAVKEVLRLKKRIEEGGFGSMTVYDRRITHVDPIVQFLMSIPRVGKTRATFIRSRFSSLVDLIERSEELGDMFRNENDVETIKTFIQGKWDE